MFSRSDRQSRARSRAWSGIGCSALFVLGLSSAAVSAAAPGELGLEVHDAFKKQSRFDRRSPEEVVSQLVAAGSPAIPGLFSILSGEGLDPLLAEIRSDSAGHSYWGAPDRYAGLCRIALLRLPEHEVIEFLERRCSAGVSHDVRLAAVALLGQMRSSAALRGVLSAATGFGQRLRYRSVRGTVHEALVALLGLPDPWQEVRVDTRSMDPELALLLVDAIESAGWSQGLEVLIRAMGTDELLDARIVTCIASLQSRFPWRVHHDPRPRLRFLLDDLSWRRRRAVAVALTEMGDVESFTGLVALLEDEDERVRSTALWCLRRLTGKKRSADPRVWNNWHETRRVLLEVESRRLATALEAEQPAQAMESIGRLSELVLFRHEAAGAIAGAMQQRAPQVVEAACQALARLDSRQVVPVLADSLFEPSERVRDAALQALRSLTGEDRAMDAMAWQAYLDG